MFQKRAFNFHKGCHNSLPSLKKLRLKSAIFVNTRSHRPIHFFHWKDNHFFQTIVFSRTFWVLKKWSYNFQSKNHNTFWTRINHSLRFVKLDKMRKYRPKSFVTGNKPFFETFFSNDLLGLTEINLQKAQKLSKFLSIGYRLFFDVCLTL